MQQQNNEVVQLISKQQIDKHASTTADLLLEKAFSILSLQHDYKEENLGN
jgi:hypothetical protein